MIALERKTTINILRDCTTDSAFNTRQISLTDRDVDVPARLIGRTSCHKISETASGVSAEQRPLRPAQDLNSIHVKHGESQSGHLADVNIVNIDCSRAFLMIREVVLRNASNRQTERRRAVRLGQYDCRHRLSDVTGADRTHGIEIIACNSRNRDADILRILCSLLGGYDNFL